MPRGRQKKGGEGTEKPVEDKSANAFQALADLEELGYTREEIVQILMKARDKGKGLESVHEDAMIVKETGKLATPVQQKGTSWAQLVEEEEKDMGATDAPKSWADITRANRDPSNGLPLSYVKPTEVLSFSAAELKAGAKLWDSVLIGMVVGASPSYSEVAKYVKLAWKDFGLTKIHQLRKGIFLFEFHSEEDKMKVLDGRCAIYNRFPLILKPWKSGMNINKCFDKLPIWVQFPGLNLDLWATSNLSKVASYVGIPVTTDACTAVRNRLAYARVLVEVPLAGKLPDTIPMQCDGGAVYHQQVVYEWKPVRCSHCDWLGHDVSNCRRKKSGE